MRQIIVLPSVCKWRDHAQIAELTNDLARFSSTSLLAFGACVLRCLKKAAIELEPPGCAEGGAGDASFGGSEPALSDFLQNDTVRFAETSSSESCPLLLRELASQNESLRVFATPDAAPTRPIAGSDASVGLLWSC